MTGPALPEIETGGRLTIDLSALQANFRLLQDHAGPAECAAVVKADAYGLGAERIVPALAAAGARTFFVAHPHEARVVRKAAPEAVIYVLSGLAPGSAAVLAEIGARPVLGSNAEIDEWSAFASAQNLPGEAAVHIDTGMNRLGLTIDEAASVAERFSAGRLGFRPSLVMSHLACADEPGHPLNDRQIRSFTHAAAWFPGVPASLANSAAMLSAGQYRFDLCRPGIALYGGNPCPGRPNRLKPVIRAEARVVQIRTAAAGETVGYGAAQTLARPSVLAIISLGYADGLIRAAGSTDARVGAKMAFGDTLCPVAGRISMDLVAADITDLPAGTIHRGDFATLIGGAIGVDDVAAAAGTIGYEVLTRLGSRFVRTYSGG